MIKTAIALTFLAASADAATFRYDWAGPLFDVTDGPDRATASFVVDFAGLAPDVDGWHGIPGGFQVEGTSEVGLSPALTGLSVSGLGFSSDWIGYGLTFDQDLNIRDWWIAGRPHAESVTESYLAGSTRTRFHWGTAWMAVEGPRLCEGEEGCPINQIILREATGTGTWTRSEVIPAPLPAAAWLILGGIAGLGLLRARARSAL